MGAPIRIFEYTNIVVTVWRRENGRLEVTVHRRDSHSRAHMSPCGSFGSYELAQLRSALNEAHFLIQSERASSTPRDGRAANDRGSHGRPFWPHRVRAGTYWAG